MKQTHLLFALLLTLFISSSCSLLTPVKIEPTQKYILDEVPLALPSSQKQAVTLLVLPPEIRPLYRTTKMAYRIQPHQVMFFGYNEWSENPSQMLFPLIVKMLQNTHHFHAVINSVYGGHYDYVLNTQILELQQDYTHHPPLLRLTIRAYLNRTSPNNVVSTREFSIQEPIWQKTPYGGVIAANHATAKFLQQLTQFVLNYAKEPSR